MKHIFYLFTLFLLLSCDNNEKPEVIVCPGDPPPTIILPKGSPQVMGLVVDYTTNRFLGGYLIDLPTTSNFFEMECEYTSPSDFGDVAWYDKSSKTKLFAGTIIWSGTGKRTYPEEIYPSEQFEKLIIPTPMPNAIPLSPTGDSRIYDEVDFVSVWKAVANLQWVNNVQSLTSVYFYLYTPSVGVGDPREWYWVIFL